MIKVIDDFLPVKQFMKLQYHLLFDTTFPYYYQNGKDEPLGTKSSELNQYQFTHLFFENFKENSSYTHILYDLLNKLNATALIRAKANLNPFNSKLYVGKFHIDHDCKQSKTAVFYMNDCDGYTLFKKDNKKVMSKGNRIVIFNSEEEHTGTNTTNQKVRSVLNINYYEFQKK